MKNCCGYLSGNYWKHLGNFLNPASGHTGYMSRHTATISFWQSNFGLSEWFSNEWFSKTVTGAPVYLPKDLKYLCLRFIQNIKSE